MLSAYQMVLFLEKDFSALGVYFFGKSEKNFNLEKIRKLDGERVIFRERNVFSF